MTRCKEIGQRSPQKMKKLAFPCLLLVNYTLLCAFTICSVFKH